MSSVETLQPDSFSSELDREFVPLVRGIFRLFKVRATGVSAAGLFILNQIANMERPMANEIAKTTHITTAAASQLIGQLIGVGLVRRERSPEDRRVFNLVLTKRGVEAIEVNRAIHLDILSRVFSCLSRQEGAELLRLLRKVRANNPEVG